MCHNSFTYISVFKPRFNFYIPWKNEETSGVFYIFRGVWKENVSLNTRYGKFNIVTESIKSKFPIQFLCISNWQEFRYCTAQLTFTCLESTEETLKKGVKYVKSEQQKHQNNVFDVFDVVLVDVVLVFLLLTMNVYFIPFSKVSFVDFEQINFSWVI